MGETTEKQRVAIIGVGPSGMSALKHLTVSSDKFEPVAFEKNFWPGGVWVYTDKTGKDEFGLPIHSAMYNTLKSNVPKELITFPGFPHPENLTTSYITRQQVVDYFNRFLDHYDLRKYIKTHTMVRDVSPMKVEGTKRVKWIVAYSDIRNLEIINTDVFDAVFVSNGHDFDGKVPNIPGMEKFKGRMLHSRDYRRYEEFYGLRVAILGCSYSGEDMAMQIGKVAKQVYICHRREKPPVSLPKHVKQRAVFDRMTEHTVVFPDGTEEEVDAVIFCTGYRYSYPFLKGDIIQINDGRITPIYRHMVHIKYPNLIFLNIPRNWPYIPNVHELAKLGVLMLEGKVKLPSEDEMEKDSEEDFQARIAEGHPPSFAHYMGDGDRMWRFNEVLAKMGGFEPLPPVLEMIWHDVMDERLLNLEHCNELNYVITGKSSYRCLNPESKKSRMSKAE